MKQQSRISLARGVVLGPIVAAALAGCALTPPSAPSILALPAKGKSLNQFQQDDYACRGYADQVVAPMVSSSQGSGAAAPLLGAAGGAAVGALLGAGSRNPGAVAAVGAGTGLLVGSSIGAQQYGGSQAALQQQYDNAYAQCITARGDTISAPQMATVVAPGRYVAPPPVIYAPRPYYPRPYYYSPYPYY